MQALTPEISASTVARAPREMRRVALAEAHVVALVSNSSSRVLPRCKRCTVLFQLAAKGPGVSVASRCEQLRGQAASALCLLGASRRSRRP